MFKKIILIFLLFASLVSAEEYDHYEYWYYTGQPIVAAWDPVDNAVEYETQLYHMEQQVSVATGRTSSTQIQFTCPRAGHYYMNIRAISGTETSEWTRSTDPTRSTVDGRPRSWIIYNHVAPPTGIEID